MYNHSSQTHFKINATIKTAVCGIAHNPPSHHQPFGSHENVNISGAYMIKFAKSGVLTAVGITIKFIYYKMLISVHKNYPFFGLKVCHCKFRAKHKHLPQQSACDRLHGVKIMCFITNVSKNVKHS